jgi:rhodanese-related sulfurtransferase
MTKDMNRLLTCLLAVLGLNTACGRQNFENADVQGFAELVKDSNVVVLDVRTADEFAEGHIERAVNIDYKKDDFMDRAKATLPTGKTIAIYCRSGRRSANAASMLAPEGYVLVNLKGGIIDWQNAGMPVVKAGKE